MLDRSEYSPVSDEYNCSAYFSSSIQPPKRTANDLTCLLDMDNSSMGNVSRYSEVSEVHFYSSSSSSSSLSELPLDEEAKLITVVQPSYGTNSEVYAGQKPVSELLLSISGFPGIIWTLLLASLKSS